MGIRAAGYCILGATLLVAGFVCAQDAALLTPLRPEQAAPSVSFPMLVAGEARAGESLEPQSLSYLRERFDEEDRPAAARPYSRSLDAQLFGSLGSGGERLARRIRTSLDESASSSELERSREGDVQSERAAEVTPFLLPTVARFPALEGTQLSDAFEHVQVRASLSSNATCSDCPVRRVLRRDLVDGVDGLEGVEGTEWQGARRWFRKSLE